MTDDLRIDSRAADDAPDGIPISQGIAKPFHVQSGNTLTPAVAISRGVKCVASGCCREYTSLHGSHMLFDGLDEVRPSHDGSIAFSPVQGRACCVETIERR